MFFSLSLLRQTAAEGLWKRLVLYSNSLPKASRLPAPQRSEVFRKPNVCTILSLPLNKQELWQHLINKYIAISSMTFENT